LATRDIQESNLGFAYDGALVEPQTLTIEIDGKNFDIDISITDSIKSVAQKINDQTDGKVEASILNVGGDDPYRLILKSTNTGADNKITVKSSETDPEKAITFNRIGDEPKDAEIEIDGITVTRSENSFDNLVEGVKINLQAVGKTSIKIENDNEKLVEKMSEFADKYNAVIEKLSSVTKYDKENKTAGVFQGTSEIRAITTALNGILGRTISADGKTVADFGLEPQRGGKLKFSESDFKEMLKTDAGKVEDFFRGTNGENGLFNKFEDTLFDLSTSSTGALKSLDKNIENNLKALTEEQSKAQKRLDDRYKIMTKRFAAFDSVISKLSHQSTTLQSMIDAQFAEKK
jgi:flagellar hook-associated protein 2